jgi:formate hydrogenlyase subunit 5
MTAVDQIVGMKGASDLGEESATRWSGRVRATFDATTGAWRIRCDATDLQEVCQWLAEERGYGFATLVVEERSDDGRLLNYVYYDGHDSSLAVVELAAPEDVVNVPSLVSLDHGPAVDWHEREVEDLHGLHFEGHPLLGDFVLHEDWPDGVNPMRPEFDAYRPFPHRDPQATWEPPTVLVASGSFAMPVGPVFSDFAEASHFLLETVGEDVIHTIPRFFYKYRGVEKIAEGKPIDQVLLLAERFSGTSAVAHAIAFCQAVETICGVTVPPRAAALRTVFAELERLRHHAATITGICHSTALVVATSQAALIEEDLIRLSCEISRHRYLFGAIVPGGVAIDPTADQCRHLASSVGTIAVRLHELHRKLRYSSSFLDRLEEVGIISADAAVTYGLVGPIARASGVSRDLRKVRPYATYQAVDFQIPVEQEGDGYARLRLFFRETQQSASIIRQVLAAMPEGEVHTKTIAWHAGVALGAVEAPSGAAFHCLRLGEDALVVRYRITPPAFANWHGFHLAAENFAFQDFPIILASFGLSNAECDR